MRDIGAEDLVEMANFPEAASFDAADHQARESLEGKHVCPFCGTVNERPDGACEHCSLENTPTARKTTKSRMQSIHLEGAERICRQSP